MDGSGNKRVIAMASRPMLQRLPPLEGKQEEANALLVDFDTFVRGTRILPDYCEQPHKEMCDELEACVPDFDSDNPRQIKQIYMAPRYSYKTSILVAFVCYCIFKYTNIRITLGRATHKDSRETLRSIKDALTKDNPKITEVWGNISHKAPTWTESAISHGFRTMALVGPTVVTAGIGIGQTGTHPDLVLLDDLVTEVNYLSEPIILRTRDWVTSFYAILPPHGSMVVCGTRWAYNDIYTWLMEQDDQAEEDARAEAEMLGQPEPPDGRQWRRYIRRVWEYDEKGEKILFFPSKLDEDFLARQRRALRGDMHKYYVWYFQQPYERGTKLFPAEDLQTYGGSVLPGDYPTLLIDEETTNDIYSIGTEIPVNVTMTVDAAATSGKKADFTGIVIVGCDFFDQWWVLHAEGVRKTPSLLADYCAMLIAVHSVSVCCIETEQSDPVFVSRLQQALTAMDINCAITSYSALQDEAHGERGKVQRIAAMQYRYIDHDLWIRRGSPCRDLLSQMDGWPTVDHDDVLDALSMQRHVARPSPLASYEDKSMLMEALEEADSWGPNGRPPATPAKPTRHTPRGCWTGKGSLTLRNVVV